MFKFLKEESKTKDSIQIQLKTAMWNHFKNLMMEHMLSALKAKDNQLRGERRKHTAAVIIFANLFLESFINDHIIDFFNVSEGVINTPRKRKNIINLISKALRIDLKMSKITHKDAALDNWYNLDMKPLPIKWKKAMVLITGKRLQKEIYADLRWVYDIRHLLIHNKPVFELLDGDKRETSIARILDDINNTQKAFNICKRSISNFYAAEGTKVPDMLYDFVNKS